jgi:two-component system nitrogen regulation sensor histidine kinase GlnL
MSNYESNKIERRVLDNISSALLLLNADLKLTYANTAAEEMLDVSSKHILGRKIDALIHLSSALNTEHLQRVIDSNMVFTDRELRLVLLNMREITVDCTVTPLSEEGGEVLVELQQVDRQLRINREENLISQHQVARALVRNLAHEIKNPLGGLRGAAQLLEGELPDPALCEYTQIIIDEADRLQSLVNRMLGTNRLPKNGEVNLHLVLERVATLVQAEFGSDLHIRRDYDPSIPELFGDTDLLIQAILNIVRNGARAAGSEGSLTFKSRILRQFTIGTSSHRLVARIEIEDNGPGIDPSLEGKIFYPLVTASKDGTGLGLSIAQSLVNQHDGLIEYKSEPGKTVFTVLLPMERRDG